MADYRDNENNMQNNQVENYQIFLTEEELQNLSEEDIEALRRLQQEQILKIADTSTENAFNHTEQEHEKNATKEFDKIAADIKAENDSLSSNNVFSKTQKIGQQVGKRTNNKVGRAIKVGVLSVAALIFGHANIESNVNEALAQTNQAVQTENNAEDIENTFDSLQGSSEILQGMQNAAEISDDDFLDYRKKTTLLDYIKFAKEADEKVKAYTHNNLRNYLAEYKEISELNNFDDSMLLAYNITRKFQLQNRNAQNLSDTEIEERNKKIVQEIVNNSYVFSKLTEDEIYDFSTRMFKNLGDTNPESILDGIIIELKDKNLTRRVDETQRKMDINVDINNVFERISQDDSNVNFDSALNKVLVKYIKSKVLDLNNYNDVLSMISDDRRAFVGNRISDINESIKVLRQTGIVKDNSFVAAYDHIDNMTNNIKTIEYLKDDKVMGTKLVVDVIDKVEKGDSDYSNIGYEVINDEIGSENPEYNKAVNRKKIDIGFEKCISLLKNDSRFKGKSVAQMREIYESVSRQGAFDKKLSLESMIDMMITENYIREASNSTSRFVTCQKRKMAPILASSLFSENDKKELIENSNDPTSLNRNIKTLYEMLINDALGGTKLNNNLYNSFIKELSEESEQGIISASQVNQVIAKIYSKQEQSNLGYIKYFEELLSSDNKSKNMSANNFIKEILNQDNLKVSQKYINRILCAADGDYKSNIITKVDNSYLFKEAINCPEWINQLDDYINNKMEGLGNNKKPEKVKRILDDFNTLVDAYTLTYDADGKKDYRNIDINVMLDNMEKIDYFSSNKDTNIKLEVTSIMIDKLQNNPKFSCYNADFSSYSVDDFNKEYEDLAYQKVDEIISDNYVDFEDVKASLPDFIDYEEYPSIIVLMDQLANENTSYKDIRKLYENEVGNINQVFETIYNQYKGFEEEFSTVNYNLKTEIRKAIKDGKSEDKIIEDIHNKLEEAQEKLEAESTVQAETININISNEELSTNNILDEINLNDDFEQ